MNSKKFHISQITKQVFYFLISILFVTISPGPIQEGSATVSFSCNVYNSADSVSEAVFGENLNFGGAAFLANDLVSVEGKGSSVSNRSFYSYELLCQEDHMQSAAETDSGQLAWGGSATASHNSSAASISSKAYLSDGNLTAFYKNSDVAVSESIWAPNSKFQEVARISPHSLSSAGSGQTDQGEGSSGQEDMRGFDQSLLIKGFDRWLQIDSEVLGKTSLEWVSAVDSRQSNCSLNMAVAGRSDNESGISRMQMQGSGSGFPLQSLPAGRLDVNRQIEVSPNSTIDTRFIDEEIAGFNLNNSINQSLDHWYNLEQSSIVNQTGTTSDGLWDKTLGVYFRMKMALEFNN